MKPTPVILVFLAAGLAGWLTSGTPDGRPAPPPAVPRGANRPPRASTIPAEVRERVRPLRRAGSHAERLRQAVLLASNLPLADFPLWYQGNFVEFLDAQSEDLFYQILTDRWLEADTPGAARWLVEHQQFSGPKALAQWVRLDEAAALAFYQALPGDRRKQLAPALIEAVGERSVPAALAMLDDLRGEWLNPGLIAKLALHDRDAVCAHANAAMGEARRSLLRAAAGAWLERDFSWVVAMMQREGLGPETFGEISNYSAGGNGGRAVLAHAALLPEGWLDQLSQQSHSMITLQCELDWLNLKSPKSGISEEALRRIQLQAAATPWWYNDKREAGLELVANGDWLPLEARAKIARTLALRWQDDPAAARSWIDGLTGELRDAAEQGYATMQQELSRATQATQTSQPKTPAQLIGAIADGSATGLPQLGNAWNEGETTDATRLANSLEPDKAARMLGDLQHNSYGLPDPVAAAIVSRGLLAAPAPDGTGGPDQRVQTRAASALASRWGAQEPAAAAAWVETLPPGEARLWALKNVALQWEQYSTAEARAWAATLPDAERQAVSSAISRPAGTNR